MITSPSIDLRALLDDTLTDDTALLGAYLHHLDWRHLTIYADIVVELGDLDFGDRHLTALDTQRAAATADDGPDNQYDSEDGQYELK